MNQDRVAELAPGYPWNVSMALTTASITSLRRTCNDSRPLWQWDPGQLLLPQESPELWTVGIILRRAT